MSYIWFNSVLEALGKRLNFESISNIYGNSFVKDSAKYVNEANPLIKTGARKGGNLMDLAASIKIVKSDTSDTAEVNKTLSKALGGGDIGWVGDMFNKNNFIKKTGGEQNE